MHEWSRVDTGNTGAYTERLTVPGGWLYRVCGIPDTTMAFVPDEPAKVEHRPQMVHAPLESFFGATPWGGVIVEAPDASIAAKHRAHMAAVYERDELRDTLEGATVELASAIIERDEARVLASELRTEAKRVLLVVRDCRMKEPDASLMRSLNDAADRVPAGWEVEP